MSRPIFIVASPRSGGILLRDALTKAEGVVSAEGRLDAAIEDRSPRVRAPCEFAQQVTLRPASVEERDVEALRSHGWSDTAISDAIQVIAYFNYINRVVDAVGVVRLSK